MKRSVLIFLVLSLLFSVFLPSAASAIEVAWAEIDEEETTWVENVDVVGEIDISNIGVFTVTHTANSWAALRTAIGTVSDNSHRVIAITSAANFNTGTGAAAAAITIPATNHVTIITDPALGAVRTISQNTNSRHFIVNGNLTIANLQLTSANATGNVGRGGVEVNANGTFTMEVGSAITNSRWTNGITGAVRVNNGSFTMNGGVLSGNATNAGAINRGGAGVFVTGTNGRFILNDGEITNNHVLQTTDASLAQGGGGVAIDMGATFEMYGGEITRNTVTAFRTATQAANYQGGGGVLVGRDGAAASATSHFFMYGGEIADNTATHALALDVGAGEGGGVFVAPRGDFRMYGGAIIDNFARSNGRGGGGVFVLGGRFATANPTDNDGNVIEITEKLIADNRARAGGGGILAIWRDPTFNITGGIAGEVIIAEGTIIRGNRAGLAESLTPAAGVGGGIFVRWGANLIIEGGEIYNNTALRPGGGVAVQTDAASGAISVTMRGGRIFGNHARGDLVPPGGDAHAVDRGNGGGVSIVGISTWNMMGGEIAGNQADMNGGGVRVTGGAQFTMSGTAQVIGNIVERTVHNGPSIASGGGVFVEDATFTLSEDGRIAENQIRASSTGTTIQRHVIADGGGVFVTGTNAVFTMQGGITEEHRVVTERFGTGA